MRKLGRLGRSLLSSKSAQNAIQPLYIGPPNFTGGRNVDWAQDMASGPKEGGVLPNQCIELENFDIDEQGILAARRGCTKLNSTALNSGAAILSMYRYHKSSTGTKYFLVQAGDKVGTFNTGTGAFSQVATGLAQTAMKWLTWNDYAYAFNGTGVYKFDGTTWSQVQDTDADAPDSVDAVVADEVMFAARDGDTYASRLHYSDEFDGDSWSATNFVRINERDGQQIMSLMRIDFKIMVLKDLSIYYLHGTSQYDFVEEKLSSEIGQFGRMANCAYENKAFFQSNRGIEYYDPNTPKKFNNIARGTCSEEIMGYSRTQRDAAFMCYYPEKDRLLVSYPTVGTPTIYVFYLQHPQIDEDGNVWFPHSIYTGLTVRSMMVSQVSGDAGTMYWGSNDGYVYQYDTAWTDAGTAIATKLKWGYTDCGLPYKTKCFTRLVVPARCTSTLTATLNSDFSRDTDSKTTTSYLPSGAAVWDSGVWDTSLWAEADVSTRVLRYHSVNAKRLAVYITRSNSDIYELHPFHLEYYPKEFQKWL